MILLAAQLFPAAAEELATLFMLVTYEASGIICPVTFTNFVMKSEVIELTVVSPANVVPGTVTPDDEDDVAGALLADVVLVTMTEVVEPVRAF